LAALRAGINTVLAPDRNRKDLEDIPPNLRKKIKFIFVKDARDVLKIALKDGKLARAKKDKKTSVKTARKKDKPKSTAKKSVRR